MVAQPPRVAESTMIAAFAVLNFMDLSRFLPACVQGLEDNNELPDRRFYCGGGCDKAEPQNSRPQAMRVAQNLSSLQEPCSKSRVSRNGPAAAHFERGAAICPSHISAEAF